VKNEGFTRVYLARILLFAGKLDAAEREARAAIDTLAKLASVRAYAQAVLGQILLGDRRAREAHAATEEAMRILASAGALEEGESFVRLVHAEALSAIGDTAAAHDTIRAAARRLRERAARLDAQWRATFLENVFENKRTLALEAEWLGTAGA
jgi:hypothetical protein